MSELQAAAILLGEEMVKVLTNMDKVEMAMVYHMNSALGLPFGVHIESYLDNDLMSGRQAFIVRFKVDTDSIKARKDARDWLAAAKHRANAVGVSDE